MYRNLSRTAAEMFLLRRRVRPSNWREYAEIEGLENAVEAFLPGKGCILVTGHFGNWEFLGHVLPYIGIRSKALARPLDNPLLDRYILGVRESGLQRILLKQGSGGEVERTLARGGFVSILVDQDAGNRGAFVPFFGRLASTWRSAARPGDADGRADTAGLLREDRRGAQVQDVSSAGRSGPTRPRTCPPRR